MFLKSLSRYLGKRESRPFACDRPHPIRSPLTSLRVEESTPGGNWQLRQAIAPKWEQLC
ncbi:MAG TPA: hypothetical protein V6D27_03055 [Vampirovibrionales bacterium]